MTTSIDKRLETAGFVMVDVGTTRQRRMAYAPHRNDPSVLVLSPERNWGALTSRQAMACRDVLQREYSNYTVILDNR